MEAAILVVIMIAGFTYSAIKTKESWKNRCKRTLKENMEKNLRKGIQKRTDKKLSGYCGWNTAVG